MMQSFLNTTSAERMKNQVARTWVRQVRDLSYDTEDCIEFVLHLDTKRSFWRRLVRPNMVQTLLPLDKAVAEIKQLKARAEEVNQRNLRYNLIGNSGEQVQQMSASSQRTMNIFIKPRDAFDEDNRSWDLTRFITTEEKGLQVVSVYGTGGDLGMVTIIKKMYDDEDIQGMFHFRSWVKLMRPFNPQEFIQCLLAGFYTKASPQEQGADVGLNVLASMKTTQYSILADFMERLKKKTYLIVLEDLTSAVEWNAIRSFLPDHKSRSRIVVSTQQQEIASMCTGQPYHVRLLREFSTDHSVYTFFKDLPKYSRRVIKGSKCIEESSRCDIFFGPEREEDKHWQDKHKVLGRDWELKKLDQQLRINYDERLSVISVCGIVGVGKSFLVEAFCHHYMEIFVRCAIVSAPHPFDIMDFCQSLVLCFKLEAQEEEGIVALCWKYLEEHRCLLVIDRLRSKEDWDLIDANLISRALKSFIIVITREESVARHCATSDDAVCIVKGLQADAAIRLFEKEAKSHIKPSNDWNPNITEEARLFVNKCGRLPKLIVALSQYLANVPNAIWEAQRLNANFMYALKSRKGLDIALGTY
ncbi:unnamed protein product [Urochloa humidicola]